MENVYNLLWKPIPNICRLERVFGEVCMDDSEPSAHDWTLKFVSLLMVSVTSYYFTFLQALNLTLNYDLSSLSCINMTEQMGPWKKRWKNKKLAVFISEENGVWTSKWRIGDNRDKYTCHQLVNQWRRKRKCGRELISTRVNKGITPWTNVCTRCDRASVPCGYHNREGMLGSDGPQRDTVKL